MNNWKRLAAALLALCLALGVFSTALGENRLNDLLGYYHRFTGEAETETEAPVIEPGSEPVEAPAEAPTVESEGMEGTGLADEDEEITPPETLIQVDDLSLTEGLSGDWRNILLLGTDSRTDQQYSRTDTMIILSVNPADSQVKLTSLMRDLWVNIPGHGGAKLNAACVYGGPQLTVRCVNEHFGMNIQSYVLVNMQCLSAIVEMLGGIQMDVTEAEAAAINKLFDEDRNIEEVAQFVSDHVSAGSQVWLNGNQALAYARIRKLDSDYARTERQRKVLVTIAKQMQQKDLLTLAGMVTNLMPYVETDLSFDEIMALAATAMKSDLESLAELRLPVDGTYESGTFNGTWCIRPNFEENTRLLHEFIYG